MRNYKFCLTISDISLKYNKSNLHTKLYNKFAYTVILLNIYPIE